MPNNRPRSDTSIVSIALASLAATACPDPLAGESTPEQLEKGPGLDPSEAGAPAECTPEQITSGKLIAQRTFERAKGKPVVETMQFPTAPGEEVCILLHTGATGSGGEQLRPAPASLTVEVDTIEIVAPNDVDAHPQVFTRRLGPDALPAGSHTLSAELHGKPSSVLSVSVLAVSDEPPAGFSAVTYMRLVDSSKNLTTVRDEMVVGAELGTPREELQASLSGLPFTAVIIGSSLTSPVFQILVPGFSLGDPEGYIAGIEALGNVQYAGPHYASMLAPAAAVFPPAGSDPLYLDDNGPTTVIDDQVAWHLTKIRAPEAWSEQQAGAPVAVLDVGFDMALADLAEATCMASGGDCSMPQVYETCAEDEASAACKQSKDCSGPADAALFHGNSVAGILAARSDDQGVLGVSWDSPLLLDSFRRRPHYDPDALVASYGHVAELEILAALDRFVTDPLKPRIINLSFGMRKFCSESGERSEPNDEVWNDSLDQSALMMTSFLSANRDVLIVEAAGNEGGLDEPVLSHEAGYGRRLLDSGFYARNSGRHPDLTVKQQLLAVGAGTVDIPVKKVARYTNPGGSLLVAPVGEGGSLISTLDAGDVASVTPRLGTSFAAPQVAGVASLMLQENPKLAANHVRRILLDTASDYAEYKDEDYRLLDAYAAVREAKRWTCSGYTEIGSGVCPVFWDLSSSHRYYASIHELSCHCVLKGYPEGDFRAGQGINRAEMLKVVVESLYPQSEIAKFEGEPSSFPDVPADEWYGKYVALAEAHGFITGIDGLFLPGDPVNRAEAVTILARAAYAMGEAGIAPPADSRVEALAEQYKHHGGPKGEMPPQPFEMTYPDVTPAEWFYPSVEATADLCIFGGTDVDNDPDTENKFLPGQPLLRGEAAHLACRTRFADDAVCSPKSCAQ